MSKGSQTGLSIELLRFKKNTCCLLLATVCYSGSLQAQDVLVDLPRQPLTQSIQQLATLSGIEILVATDQLHDIIALPVQGQFPIKHILERMLLGSDLMVQQQGQIYVIVERSVKPTVQPVAVAAQTSTLQQSQHIATQPVVEMYLITAQGDKDRDTQGYDNVYEKNRSSTYAGKEYVERFQGTNPADVVKGMVGVYSGDARNSGALDPSVRGVQGVGRVPLTIDGTEQSVAVWRGYNGVNNRNYIDPNLIGGIEVIKGPSLERNTTTSVGGGVVVKTLEAGDIVRPGKKIGAEIKLEGANNSVKPSLPTLQYLGQKYEDTPAWDKINHALYDPDIYKANKTKSDNDLFSGDDVAGRIAVATQQDKFDLLAVYAERDRGNYFSGTNNSSFYKKAEPSLNQDFIPYFAYVYVPGSEVPNTSSHMTSWLLKGNYRPTDEQNLKLTYRQTDNEYGEILPSRIQWFVTPETGVPQWPLSTVESKAYSLDYSYTPEDNRWVDLNASLWQTDTESHTYTRGGWPTAILYPTNIITNTAVQHADNTRRGVNLSNKINLTNSLNLTLGASLLQEKLSSDDPYNEFESNAGSLLLPRAGEREEKTFDFNFNYAPNDWLTLEAGMRYRNYWAFDDFLSTHLQHPALDDRMKGKLKFLGYSTQAYIKPPANTDPRIQRSIDQQTLEYQQLHPEWNGDARTIDQNHRLFKLLWNTTSTDYREWVTVISANDQGKLTQTEIPQFDPLALGEDKVFLQQMSLRSQYEVIPITAVEKTKANAWAPQLSAAIRLNEHNRIYVRYAEEYRMPSLFESTMGFSASVPYLDLKPEHTFNTEVGYIFDARQLFKNVRHADLKLSYFHHKTKDVIERDLNLVFSNMEQHVLEGLELQSRYDNGHIFADFSVAYNLENEVCDEDNAMKNYLSDGGKSTYKKCVQDGFPDGYLATMATPEVSLNGLFGVRLLDEKLELGARATYYKGYESFIRKNGALAVQAGYYLNVPLTWDSTWLFDAYANYQINPQTKVEFVGTNLSNEFYIDPLTRSAMAAPGRTLKMGISYKF